MAAVVEEAPEPAPPAPEGELEYRLRQQRILADFGVEALRSRDTAAMLHRATELCADGMHARLCKFLTHQREADCLLVTAGVGWKPGIVGEVAMAADLGSPAGFALQTGVPVISNHLEDEVRFRTPQFMAEHGVKRAINVLVEANGERYGVLEVDSPVDGRFAEADLSFMQGFASLIGVAIERQHTEERLNAAVEHQEMLTREASHRVKNSLMLVSAMLNLQMQEDEDPRVRRLLGDAQARITAIAQAHDQLWRGDTVGLVALDDLVCGLIDKIAESAPRHVITCEADRIVISADVAIPLGLVLTELVTNAIKYAYGGAGGAIAVTVCASGERVALSVSDAGIGMPRDFDIKTASRDSLGMRMVASLTRQLGGTISFADAGPGTCATLDMADPRTELAPAA